MLPRRMASCTGVRLRCVRLFGCVLEFFFFSLGHALVGRVQCMLPRAFDDSLLKFCATHVLCSLSFFLFFGGSDSPMCGLLPASASETMAEKAWQISVS